MNGFPLYLIKASLGIAIVSLPYFLFLRKDPNLVLKRVFLLSGLLLSFIAPLLNLHFSAPALNDNQVFFLQLDQPAGESQISVPGQHSDSGRSLILSRLLLLVYLAGIALLAGRNLLSMLKWNKFKKTNTTRNEHILYGEKEEVFTLFRTIHLPRSVIGSDEHQSMLIHEQAHVRQAHFIDLVLCETALFITWFNPFTWLITRMIKENHEHLADREVLSSGIDPVRYRAHLLNRTLGVPVFRLGLAFSNSLTKNRFDMMKNRKSHRNGLVKVALLIPVMMLTFGCLSNSKAQEGKIKGVIRFADTGKPAQGASVIISGTTTGTITDEKGKFILELPGESAVTVSFVGYKTCVNTFKPGEQVSFDLVPDVVNLELQPVAEEKPGIILKGNDGQNPIYLVDGQKVEDITSINPDDIEKIEVFKDKKILAEKFPGKETSSGVISITMKKEAAPESEEEDMFIVVEDMPRFPGGKTALSEYVYSHLQYPEEAKAKALEGSVLVQFTVNKEGQTEDISVASSSDKIFNEAAMAVFTDMPAWKPGFQRGQAVPVKFAVRVDFKLPAS